MLLTSCLMKFSEILHLVLAAEFIFTVNALSFVEYIFSLGCYLFKKFLLKTIVIHTKKNW